VPEFDAILFDFDGVLADSEPIHFACWQEVLAPLGITLDWAFYRDCCIGVADTDMLRVMAARSDPPRAWEDLVALYPEKKERFRARMLANPPFAPGLPAVLERLHAGYRLAVVTSSGRTEVEAALAAAGLGTFFDALVCGREAGPLKPAPEPYLLAAKLLGAVRPLVVEDSEPGIASGRAAGFEVLAVKSAATTPDAVLRRLWGPGSPGPASS